MSKKLWVKNKGLILGRFDVTALQRLAADHWLHPLYLVSGDKELWVDAIEYKNGLLWEHTDDPPEAVSLQVSNDQIWVKERGRMLGPYSLQKLQELAAQNWLSKMHLVSENRIHWVFANHFRDGIAWHENATPKTADQNTPPIVEKKPVKPPPENQWWYAENRQPIGPLPLTRIRNLFGMGELTAKQLVWTPGMDDWKPAREITEFQRYLTAKT